jgi:SAM-dependent methyltransferase
MTTNDNDRIRKGVSAFYGRAVRSGTGCCSGSGCGCGGGDDATGIAGFAAQFPGYDAQAAGLPADAVANSFGCGNPLAFSEVEPGEVVLDLGSGAGIDLLIAARKVGPTGRVIGIDMTDEMITRARANAAEAGFTNIEVRKGIIEDLPVDAASVDWVISNCVINLSPEKHRVFAEIARVLKPGGRMRVSDIVVEDLPAWARDHMGLYASCVSGAVSQAEYLEGLTRAGLVDIQVPERFPYGQVQVREILDADPGESAGPDHANLASAIAGKVWSATFCARKPK